MPPRRALPGQSRECVLQRTTGAGVQGDRGEDEGVPGVRAVVTRTSGRPTLRVATSFSLSGSGMVQ